MTIKVKSPGIMTSVQDLGRPGYYHLGIPISGAMDRRALRVANLLVGNEEGAAALESVFLGPEILFQRDSVIAITGANISPKIDNQGVPMWSSLAIKQGQTLSFDFIQSGARMYIAVAGGIDVPQVLGSRSSYVLGALGGFQGRGLMADDELPLGPGASAVAGKTLPEALRRSPAEVTRLRMVPDIYWNRITPESQRQFLSEQWKVAPEADRIGYRFKGGTPLAFVEREQAFGAGSDPSNIVDSCYPYGSIQVPGGKEPIVLHRDAVSGGGYFMLGTVISADMDLIGQLQPHSSVQFEAVDIHTALKARQEERRLLERIRAALA